MFSLYIQSEYVSIFIHITPVKIEKNTTVYIVHLKSKLTLTMMENSYFQPLYKISSGNIGMLCKNNSGFVV